ncbi:MULTISPECIES: endopeptidase La [unclassified Arcicella]|uniref:endopeptidase La n=1 Tax=unclassified Arcicella TaxID=2644986 RepID=UPI00285C7B0E|nr:MULTISPECIES: endopeptidase La [unclassified Arcicella]MDR6563694.1 ATP-dependent Lon protease [Arcicella sp. BE51]MDR6814784.1 ATP-dependent Lon protease [Arcicella sp. BE140]MDR6826212.1 ATP-dependent Lon protease [Arcicella sp. BE139]
MSLDKNFLNNLKLAEISDFDGIELIPLGSEGVDDEKLGKLTDELPILPIRNVILFPGMVIPITVGRQKSVRLVKKAYKGNRTIGVITQANPNKEEPVGEDLYKVGTVAHIIKMIVLPGGNTTIIVQGRKRFEVQNYIKTEPNLIAKVNYLEDNLPAKLNKENKALIQSLREMASRILFLNPEIPREAQIALDNIESPSFLIHFLSANVNAELAEKQQLLETINGLDQARKLLELMMTDIDLLEIKREIQSKASSDIDQQQRDYYLRQQIKVLQEELGVDSPEAELDKIRAKGVNKKWSKEVSDHFQKELAKLQRTNSMSAEYPMLMNYVELLVDLPWNEITKDNFDLKKAQKVLDFDHFGLEKVKERIIEYLAVLKMKGNMKAPILCLYGPPGVGKTSLGKSIAKALGRKYIRMALGGLHDESEIRGHRKTYIGAMPGKLIQNIKKAGSANPVFILDEIDKVGSDHRGDPSSALLEVLDPEQNNAFMDNYLEIEYDLSKVLFIATANSLDSIHPALRDRMEIIDISGYTMEEKVQIAKKHLVPKQKEEHGLENKTLTITDAALQKLIEGYTRESGVRKLEQQVGKLIRKVTKSIAMQEEYPKVIKPEEVVKLLGQEYFDKDLYETNDTAGVVTGLAWTPVGGDILFIESILNRGKGGITLSGQLGDVMKESAMAALSYLRAHADEYGIDYRIFDNYNLHVHVPAGAVPKDGPSAGITMTTSIASALTQCKVKPHLAMTGEVTLRGKVLPVGGIKEKILAAKRAGIQEIILCHKNRKDVEEITPSYISDLTFHYVDMVDEVLQIALMEEKVSKPINFIFPEDKREVVLN